MKASHRDPLHIRNRLLILFLVSLSGMIALLLLLYSSLYDTLNRDKQDDIERLIATGLGIARYFHNQELQGSIDHQRAQELALQTLRATRHGDDSYIWVNDMNGVILMHPILPDLEGRNMIDSRDGNDKLFMTDFIRAAQNGGGWVDYLWTKPEGQISRRKRSYVAPFTPWGWVIGTGLYLDDTEGKSRHEILKGISITILFALLLLAVAMGIAKRFLEQLATMATHDALTGLRSRRYLYEAGPAILAQQQRKPNERLAAIFLDIDHFKRINDNYSHECGDMVLARVGNAIQRAVRSGDLAVRYGGEELVVLMPCKHDHDAILLAERIRNACHTMELRCEEESLSVTLSAGIAYSRPDESLDSLLHRADNKLYMAKEEGRDRVIA